MARLKDGLKKHLRRYCRKLVVLFLIYVAGFVTAAYWAVSSATDTADTASDVVQTRETRENQTFPESVGQAAHKSVEYAGDAARKTGRFIKGQSDEDKTE